MRALDRAEKALDADLRNTCRSGSMRCRPSSRLSPLGLLEFGRGERFVYKTLPHAEFDEVLDQVKRWKLDDFLKERSYEGLAAR